MASPLVVTAGASDGQVLSYSATYLTARAGTGSLGNDHTANNYDLGQVYTGGTYYLYELFIQFDTSGIPDDATVTAVELKLRFSAALYTYTVNVREHDWGTAVTNTDWVAGADASGKTLLASYASASLNGSGYTTFTSEDAFITAINKTGATRMVICSSRVENGDVPVGNERLLFYPSEKGAGYTPTLTVTYTEAVTGNPAYYYAQM